VIQILFNLAFIWEKGQYSYSYLAMFTALSRLLNVQYILNVEFCLQCLQVKFVGVACMTASLRLCFWAPQTYKIVNARRTLASLSTQVWNGSFWTAMKTCFSTFVCVTPVLTFLNLYCIVILPSHRPQRYEVARIITFLRNPLWKQSCLVFSTRLWLLRINFKSGSLVWVKRKEGIRQPKVRDKCLLFYF
jgi:hypothetical protein